MKAKVEKELAGRDLGQKLAYLKGMEPGKALELMMEVGLRVENENKTQRESNLQR